MVAHHTVGGCNLQPGDLLGTGTISRAVSVCGGVVCMCRRALRFIVFLFFLFVVYCALYFFTSSRRAGPGRCRLLAGGHVGRQGRPAAGWACSDVSGRWGRGRTDRMVPGRRVSGGVWRVCRGGASSARDSVTVYFTCSLIIQQSDAIEHSDDNSQISTARQTNCAHSWSTRCEVRATWYTRLMLIILHVLQPPLCRLHLHQCRLQTLTLLRNRRHAHCLCPCT